MVDVRGKHALVTGAGIRVGRAIADALVDAGAHVAFHHHGSYYGDRIGEDRARDAGLKAVALDANLLDDAAAKALPGRARDALGGLDLVVNSAAVFEQVPFEQISLAQLDRMLGLDFRAPFLVAQGAAPLLRLAPGGGGCLVNILDIAAERPWAGYAHYCAAKAALRMLTLGLAKELGPDLRVNGVAPGAVLFPRDEGDRAARLARIHLKREGSPADVADAVLFLWRSPYVTGELLAVDGGARL